MSSFWSEIHDSKVENARQRPKSAFRYCDECKAWQGHEAKCSKVTVEALANLLKQARKNEESVRGKAARWLESLQIATGKNAILKHENNKLRKANNKLRADVAELAECLRDLHDYQNGPPLIKYQDEWQAAIEKTITLLNKHGA